MPVNIGILGTLLSAADPSGFSRNAPFRPPPTLDGLPPTGKEKPHRRQRGCVVKVATAVAPERVDPSVPIADQ